MSSVSSPLPPVVERHAAAKPAAADEVLYQGERSFVTRRVAPGGGESLILKRAIGAEAIHRLGHERSVMQRLAGVQGIVRMADGTWPDDVIALHDDAGTTLADTLTPEPMDLQDVLAIGLLLSETLASVHRRGIVHGDINPTNILLAGPARRPVLIDFNIAVITAEASAQTALPPANHFAGTLAYMPPEQTGRTGRSVDARSDLYSLGAVLYQLATGRTLFEAEDLLDVLHHQLTTVPTPPAALVPGLPQTLSDLLMRLLEKEPDHRYQSAEGLAHDLSRLVQAHAFADTTAFPLGERDFPARLAPREMVGRERERAALERVLTQATRGPGMCVLLSGEAGVGKTLLVNQLRKTLARSGGWFVSGRFDTRHSEKVSATVQAMAELGRLLLSQPEAELALVRKRLLAQLGVNAGSGITRIPEFKLLLGDLYDESVGLDNPNQRAVEGAIDVLRAVVSHERPLVMLLDDAHLAPEVSTRFVDTVLASRAELPGLVLVMAWQPEGLEPGCPLTAALARWTAMETPPMQVSMGRLAERPLSDLVASLLRLGPHEAGRLADVLADRTQGNPQDTVELINALRHDGLLEPSPAGWRWDEQAIRRFVGENDTQALVARRLAKLPQASQSLMETLACLDKEVPLALLEAAADPALGPVPRALTPAIDDGLVLIESRDEPVYTFRNQCVAQCVKSGLVGVAERRLCLAIARRLAELPSHHRQAAQQYIKALPEVSEPAERRRAAALLHDAAQLSHAHDAEASERFAKAAIDTLLPIETPDDAEFVLTLLMLRHQVLYGLGRHEEGDATYAAIAERCADPFRLAEPAGVQMLSLATRGLAAASVALGLQTLEQLGLRKPDDLPAAIHKGLLALSAWAADPAKQHDLTRPEANSPELLVTVKFMKRFLTPAFNHDKSIHTWLLLECHRLWVLHGPCPDLMSTIASLAILLAAALKNYRAAHATARHAMVVGEARGYEPGTSIARVMYVLCAHHWVEPLEDCLPIIRAARRGLEESREMQYIAPTYGTAAFALIETAGTLDDAMREIDSALAFEESTRHDISTPITLSLRQFVRAMRGEAGEGGSFDDQQFNEERLLAGVGNPSTPTMLHVLRAMSSLVFNELPVARQHARAAMALAAATPAFYANVPPYFCLGVALAEDIRTAGTADTGELLKGLDDCRAWLAERAVDAPANFLHMACLLDAERAWALGQPWAAAGAYERAVIESSRGSRPWHRAVICERAARFYFSHGLDHTGRPLLQDATRAFQDWGATGKVRALTAEFPFLRSALGSRRMGLSGRSTATSSEAVDMMAVLRASQALSSETSLASLNACVAKVLGAMCGATSVTMVVRPLETTGWVLATTLEQGGTPLSAEEAGARGLLPLSAFRYAERTAQPLLLEDAARDPRFSADPAVAGLEHCSLLLVPIQKHGVMQAMLVLENRMRHSAFSADRLDAVTLIAGQLAVSLDNALLYASLESKVAERTAALEEANLRLEQLSVTDALTGLANRRQFNEALDVEWQRARRAGSPVGLAMIDIDQFKQYNDHYGHQGGDLCLQRVADAMKGALRAGTDLLARYGGEEFVLLLRDSDLEGTRACAERVRAAVAAMHEPHAKVPLGIVTVSIGVASWVPGPDNTAAQCLEAADTALYRAKREGRNQVSADAAQGEATAPR